MTGDPPAGRTPVLCHPLPEGSDLTSPDCFGSTSPQNDVIQNVQYTARQPQKVPQCFGFSLSGLMSLLKT